ncbi:peptide ABC transporter permease [Dissulfurispira thermophila]|uniref:Peptide ABC transporter permease n=2 Tax=root TaxID=1 RepID=A0A7G1GY62_9BACT|nr:oligopeptide ABC transporter permease [Dissulfurispira thermophila]BCB95284.1 peptide ABC transporter permease [Dissulfurispira thermophila]
MRLFWKRFKKNKLALSGGVVVAMLFIVAIFAPYISPFDPNEIDRRHVLASPSASHPLGTDDLGRDVLSRMIYGSRISLSVGFIAIGIATIIGMIVGSISGYYGGWTDRIMMRFIDIMLSIPTFFLVLAVIAFIGPGIYNIMIIIGLTSWMGVARLVRAEFLSLKEREFVLAAKALGASDMRIILRHILVNSLAPVFVSAILGVASAILVESALSFLGIGVQPPTPSWGNMLTAGKDNIEIAWWLSVFPGIAILITVLSYNLFGEGLRDALDPRLWSSRS